MGYHRNLDTFIDFNQATAVNNQLGFMFPREHGARDDGVRSRLVAGSWNVVKHSYSKRALEIALLAPFFHSSGGLRSVSEIVVG